MSSFTKLSDLDLVINLDEESGCEPLYSSCWIYGDIGVKHILKQIDRPWTVFVEAAQMQVLSAARSLVDLPRVVVRGTTPLRSLIPGRVRGHGERITIFEHKATSHSSWYCHQLYTDSDERKPAGVFLKPPKTSRLSLLAREGESVGHLCLKEINDYAMTLDGQWSHFVDPNRPSSPLTRTPLNSPPR